MSLFACLVCEKIFKHITSKDLLESDRDDTIVATKCGHLFHRTCLDCAFVLQKVKFQVENRPERRYCPYKSCQQEVTGFPLVQINPVEVQVDHGNEIRQLKNTIEKLTVAKEELLKEIQNIEKRENEEKIKEGDKVYWKEKEGKYTCAIVQELQAKIKIENVGSSSKSQMVDAIRSKFYNLPFMQDQTVPLTELLSEQVYMNYESLYKTKTEPRPDSTMSRDSGFSASGESSPMESLSHWSPPNSAGLGQQPKWMAGDRVFFPKEKQHATIKWIGYSEIQYKFIVGIEYDEPVGDTSLDAINIPVRFKLGHGRKLDYDELNSLGIKEDINKNVFGLGRFMFGSGRRKGPPPPARSRSFQQNCNEIEKEENKGSRRKMKPFRSFSSPDANPNSRLQ